MEFDWDQQKARANLAKHGVVFETAEQVFRDPYTLIEPDDSDPADERWRSIGLAGGRCAVRGLRRTGRRHHPYHLGQKGQSP